MLERLVEYQDPFRHFHLEDVFPPEAHKWLVENLPSMTRQKKDALDISALGGMWKDLYVTQAIGDAISEKLGTEKGNYKSRLVRDPAGYSLGPHTDDPKKVWAFVYYITGENGTVLFTPKKPGFQHDGTAHLEFKDFKAAKRISFKPNSMVGFARTNTSFHGVEKTNNERWTLLFNCFS